jgi:hypothetical protein
MSGLCPPRLLDGEPHACGKTVLDRAPRTNPADRCPGALFLCDDCIEPVGEFFETAYNARAVDREHGR